MKRRQLVWLTPILVVGLVLAFVYPLSAVVYREQPIQTEQLLGRVWVLRSLVADGQTILLSNDSGITIEFDEKGMVSGSGGCNNFFGEYQASGEYTISAGADQGDGDQVGVAGTQIGGGGTIFLGPIAHTEIGCRDPPGIMEQENQFFTALRQVTLFQVTSETLKLFSQDEPSSTLLSFAKFTVVEPSASFETIAKDSPLIGNTERQNYVIRDDIAWENLWGRIHPDESQRHPPLPEVDFTRNMVIAVFQGTRAPGYSTEVMAVVSDDPVKVFVTETSPGETCIVPQVARYPHHIIETPRIDTEVVFLIEHKITHCP